MADSNSTVRKQDTNDVKTVGELRRSVSIHPDFGRSAQLALLAKVHGLHGRAEFGAAARLHFHKRDVIRASHDEVDIAMSAAKAMRDDVPTLATHPTRRDTFALQSECLSLFRHGATIHNF